jgi:hypothetical protein
VTVPQTAKPIKPRATCEAATVASGVRKDGLSRDHVNQRMHADIQARLDREQSRPGPIGSPSWRRCATPAESQEYREACHLLDELHDRVPYLLAVLRQEPRRRDALRQLLEPIVRDVLSEQQGGQP